MTPPDEIDTAIADYRRIYPQPTPLAPNLSLAWRAAQIIRHSKPGTRDPKTGHPSRQTGHPATQVAHSHGCPVLATGAQLGAQFSGNRAPKKPQKQAAKRARVPSGARFLQHIDPFTRASYISTLNTRREPPTGKPGTTRHPSTHSGSAPTDVRSIPRTRDGLPQRHEMQPCEAIPARRRWYVLRSPDDELSLVGDRLEPWGVCVDDTRTTLGDLLFVGSFSTHAEALDFADWAAHS